MVFKLSMRKMTGSITPSLLLPAGLCLLGVALLVSARAQGAPIDEANPLFLETLPGGSVPSGLLAPGIPVPVPSAPAVGSAKAPTPAKSGEKSGPAGASPEFAVEGSLRKNFDFWVGIYSKYTTHQVLIHDAKYIDHVYEVIDLDAAGRRANRVTKDAKRKWRNLLMSVHHKQSKPESLTADERKVYDLYKDVNEPNKFLNAAHRKRLRVQLGQSDRFKEGLYDSGRYLPLMEEVFRREGLPIELTRLPFVESSFNTRARSKVGASGVWQFMRSTGRLFLKINDSIDERNDPILATEAAAKLLKVNHESLKTWPLAVTAYNHGRQGMMRAVRRLGTSDLDEVVDSYHSRTFGFASSNFFTELLAAIEVEKNAEKYFGKVERAKPLAFYEVVIPDYISLTEVSRFMKLDLNHIKSLNQGLSESVLSGSRLIPSGYRLRLPKDEGLDSERAARVFMAGYTQIPEMFKLKQQKNTALIRYMTSDGKRHKHDSQ